MEAELSCMPSAGEDGYYDSRLMWTEKRHHYEFVGRLLKRRFGKYFFSETALVKQRNAIFLFSLRVDKFLGWTRWPIE